MTLGMIMLNKNMEKKSKSCYMDTDNFIVCIEQKKFSLILQNMLKQDLLFEIID